VKNADVDRESGGTKEGVEKEKKKEENGDDDDLLPFSRVERDLSRTEGEKGH
jgi:hypothetical protein